MCLGAYVPCLMKKLKNDMDLEYYFNINILIKWDQ